jgi:hypothetical protein
MLGRVRKPLVVAAACAALFVLSARADAGDGKKLLPLLAEIDNAPAKLGDFLAVLRAKGLDPKQDLDTMVLAGAGEVYQIVLEGRFTKDQLAAMVATSTAKKHRGVKYWSGADGEITQLGKRLVLTTPGEMTGVIDRYKKKGRSLMRSPDAAAIRGAIALVDQRHDVWFAAAGGFLGDSLDAMGFGVTFGAELDLEVQARIADAERVEDLRLTVEQGMPRLVQTLEQLGLKGFASSMVIEWDGAVVAAGATVPADELETLLRLAAMM